MRRMICIFCCMFLFFSLCACNHQTEELQEPTNFYYINKNISYNSPSGVISAETREAVTFDGDLNLFLSSYLEGPKSSNLQTYIPAEVRIVSCELSDNEAVLIFSEEFSKLSGYKLSAASCALLMSVHDFLGVNALSISVENGRLDDKDNLHLTMDDIVLMDSL